ncbi:hypothetical protein PpBr36_03819 [Pyricularia pennisetigena]|uniref:hypothetical protein n=1 Tax=Pyricularia pennisetigena TaxID=1578925 RepID=UPI00114EC8EB|nr:hypothetical protein PpBr36_03819 [Pyricularia pennisetigena]TLS31096.1 hypothetical protein PpBr36_03819 [Pyricularia pennisetigena]
MAPLQPLAHLIDPLVIATRTMVDDAPSPVFRRQAPATVTVVSTQGGNPNQQLSGGEIAGIVIGSIVGFLLIIWLIRWSCGQQRVPDEKPSYYHQEVSPRRHRSRSHHHHHHRHSRSRSRGPDVRVVTSHTSGHPGEPAEPTRVYYEKRRRSHSRY